VSEVRLAAERRTEFGKGGARRTRRAGKIPAVIYGHGADPRHVSLPAREFTNAVRHGGANVLLTLDLDGREELVIPKAIQRHAIKGTFDHVDLLAVRQGEKITVDVPLVIAGEVAAGALLNVESATVAVEAEATHLPSEIALDVEGREAGTHITAADVPLPDGVSLATDPTHLLVAIVEAPSAEQLEAEIAEAAEEMGVVEQRPVEAPEDTVAEAPEAAAAPAAAE
jgi:large subunit ribosomal protein L25